MDTPQRFKKIIFFDSRSTVDRYIRDNKRKVKSCANDELLIAMTPSVRSHLERNGFRTQNTAPYFTTESHKRVLEKSKVLVDWLRENSNFVDFGMDIHYAYRETFIFWVRLVIHYCLFEIEIVLNAMGMHQPKILCASLSGKKSVSSLQVEPEEKYLGYIVNIIAEREFLDYEDISKISTRSYNISFSSFMEQARSRIKFIFKYIAFQLYDMAIKYKSYRCRDKLIFFTTKFYQMDELAKQTQRGYKEGRFNFLKGPAIAAFNIPSFIIKLFWKKYSKIIIEQKRLFKDLEIAINQRADFFSYRGVSFAKIISQKIQDNIAHFILGQLLWTIKLNHFVDTSKPLAILSTGNRPDDLILAELCQHKNILDILISHGSHICPKNVYEITEWGEHGRVFLRAPYPFLALQSPLAEGYLNVFPSLSKTIKTGPLIWGNPINSEKSRLLFKKVFNGKYDYGKIKVVLHAGTPKISNGLRLHVYETPDEYIQALCDLANAIRNIPNAILVIKFRPSSEIDAEDLKSFVPFSEKVILNVDDAFIDLLGISDLLVSFSSTAIEEALQNRIPTLLYGGAGRYQHVQGYEITSNNSMQPSAVYYVKEAKDLEIAIKKIFELNINGNGKENHLFEPYIYPQDDRFSLVNLLRGLS